MKLLYAWLTQGWKSAMKIFKIMIPVSIVVKILQETGMINHIGDAMAPLMGWMGLPGEMGLVWASAMLGNIYAGLIAYFAIAPTMTVAQITALSTVILIAHALPIELGVTRKAGGKVYALFLVRFLFGLLAGVLMYHLYRMGGWLEYPPENVTQIVMQDKDQSWGGWLIGELRNYLLIFIIIVLLIILLDLLKRSGLIRYINKFFSPILKWLGISQELIPVTVLGMTMGLAYGGALIINEVEQSQLNKRDLFNALLLMSLCHSLIEDSLLMISIGAHYSGVFIFRSIYAFIITYIFVVLTRNWKEETMSRWFYA